MRHGTQIALRPVCVDDVLLVLKALYYFETAPGIGILIGAYGLLGDVENSVGGNTKGVIKHPWRSHSQQLYTREAAAIIESLIPNPCHALGDVNGSEAAAIIESTVSNARHALGDGDGGEAAAIKVFTTDYYSIFYR